MPFFNLGQVERGDLRSVFAYLQSLPPMKNRVPQPIGSAGEASSQSGTGIERSKVGYDSQLAHRGRARRAHGGNRVLADGDADAGGAASPVGDRVVCGRRHATLSTSATAPSRRSTRCGATAPAKRRWVRLPEGSTIDVTNARPLGLPGRHQVLEGVRV